MSNPQPNMYDFESSFQTDPEEESKVVNNNLSLSEEELNKCLNLFASF